MADCTSLLDEELSSFVFNYLTENTGSQYGEEEVYSDRLDADFPDIDLSQLDASDFDSVNCLSELRWCNDQSDASPASSCYSSGDPELFEIEDENAALLAALTDSLDGMVDEVGGLSGFPSLGEGGEGEEDLPLESDPFPAPPSPETEDPSLLKKLLLCPTNVPVSYEMHNQGTTHRHSNGHPNLKPQRPSVKPASAQERKPRLPRPQGRTCTELHRHLTTAREAEDTGAESESEEEEEGDSSSEGEGEAPAAPPSPQFSSEEELRSVVELVKYMHTYCIPSRKQLGADRREREGPGPARKLRPEGPAGRPQPPPPCPRAAPPRSVFARRREGKGHSLLQELLESARPYDVSKPYRLHGPPYSHGRGAAPPDTPPGPAHVHAEPRDSRGRDQALASPPAQPGAARPAKKTQEASFSVRRSRRLASFPGRFAKRPWAAGGRGRAETGPAARPAEEASGGGASCEAGRTGQRRTAAPSSPCGQSEKRACLCLPLTPKSTGETQYANKPFEQTLSVELCGTAGLTPPTTPPHKPVEDDLFKPEVKGESPPKASWPPAGSGGGRLASRKLPEQTELYAHLSKAGEGAEGEEPAGQAGRAKGAGARTFGDHDYCLRSGAGEGRGPQAQLVPGAPPECLDKLGRSSSPSPQQALSPHNAGQRAERPSRPPAPSRRASCCPCSPSHSPSGRQSFSCENSETCHGEKQRNKANDECRVFYIHNLPSGITQTMLRRRFEAFGEPDECKVIIKNNERCGVITYRQAESGPGPHRRREQSGFGGLRRFCRKRYIDLDEAGPGPVKSKYDAMDFDTLLKEAQKSLHR
uniref:PPARG coactivator 1 beta n=1 Tax=Lepisosteus oculatus TaxID=7918 RepID=W5N2Y9_LEPOC|nr:PREDICTED: peroxisome proliferator-activated receptor gamma coactivator 1-beta-like [Lepisosteus oculatus]